MSDQIKLVESSDQVKIIQASSTENIVIEMETIIQDQLADKADVVHTHSISDTTGLQAALDGKATLIHTHVISEITGLQSALDNKASLVHTHILSDVTGLTSALTNKADLIHTHNISEIVNLQTNLDNKSNVGHSHSISDTTGLQAALDSKAPGVHTHIISEITGLQTALDGKASSSHVHITSDITSGIFELNRGGTGADLSSTGGVNQFLKQVTNGGAISVATIQPSELPSTIDAQKISTGSVSNTEFDYLNGVTNSIQDQLDDKADLVHTHTLNQITGGYFEGNFTLGVSGTIPGPTANGELHLSGYLNSNASFGSVVSVFGDGHATKPGKLELKAGGTAGSVDLIDNTGVVRASIDTTGLRAQRIIGTLPSFFIAQSTSAGNDTSRTDLCGGGAISNARGAYCTFFGNQAASFPGQLHMRPGSTGDVQIFDSSAAAVVTINTTGVILNASRNLVCNVLRTSTSDGADNQAMDLCGGGGISLNRGATLSLRGNENVTNPAHARLFSGGISGSAVVLGGGASQVTFIQFTTQTGGTNHFLRQTTAGGTVTSGPITTTDIQPIVSTSRANSSTTTLATVGGAGNIRRGWVELTDNLGGYARYRINGTSTIALELGSTDFIVGGTPGATQIGLVISGNDLNMVLGSGAARLIAHDLTRLHTHAT